MVDLTNGPKRLHFPASHAGGFGEALPDGFYAYDSPDGIVTPEWGAPSGIGQRGLYVCLGTGHQVAFAGGTANRAYFMPAGGGMWQDRGAVFSQRPLLFVGGDDLKVIHTPADANEIGSGSQGLGFYDYETGKLWTADATHRHPSLEMLEWIRRGNITVGMAVTDELIAYNHDTGRTHLVEAGTWRFIKFRRDGQVLAFGGVRHDTIETVFLWMTEAQVNALPIFGEEPICRTVYCNDETGICPICGHSKSVHLVEDCTEEPVSIPNHFAEVDEVNRAHPELLQTNTVETCGIFTEKVVNLLAARYPSEGWGHVGKSGGQTQHVHWPGQSPSGHAADAIMTKLDLSAAIDIIGGGHNAPNPGHPAWIEAISGGQPWLAPIPGSGEGGGEGGGGEGGGGGTDLAALEARVKALEANAVLYGQLIGVRCHNGTVVAIMPDGGPSKPYENVVFESRDVVGPWESLKIERGTK